MTAFYEKKIVWSLDIPENPASPDGLRFWIFDTKLDSLQ
jgi:hypothetical protein